MGSESDKTRSRTRDAPVSTRGVGSRDHTPPPPRDAAHENPLIVLLVPGQDSQEELSRVLSARLASDELRVELMSTPAADAISQARQEFGNVPIGLVTDDEVGALDALANGADEVLLWPPRDDFALVGFLERTKLRASLRVAQDRRNAAVAHAEKLASLGTLVAGVAHEINNPLTVLRFGLEACSTIFLPLNNVAKELNVWSQRGWGASPEQIRELSKQAETGASPQEDEQLLEEMLSATASIANIVKDLGVFSRANGAPGEAQLLDLNDTIDHALRLVGRQLSAVAHVERDYSRDLPQLKVPQGRLTQVLVNILVNAAHAVAEIERPLHRVRISSRSDGEFVAISVEDTGPGILPTAVERIFDPFFTTKRAGHGTGLGLSISRSIMHDLGGDLLVESVHQSGATFILLLPIPEEAPLTTHTSPAGISIP